MACNTGSVHALEAMRAEFEPDIPVIGTVPAIKPAAAAHRTVAIWATVATTASAYQRGLIAKFGGSAHITAVACPGLADAVDAGDEAATTAAVAAAAVQTPASCQAVVLGCTEYELVADQISQAVPGAVTFGSATAVAAQALRRIPGTGHADVASLHPAGTGSDQLSSAGTWPSSRTGPSGSTRPSGSTGPSTSAGPSGSARLGSVRVLLSGRPAGLPPAALRYPEGRLLAPLVVVTDSEPMAGSAAGR
jgi:glutamate racemase